MTYLERFETGTAGWYHFAGNHGIKPLEWSKGSITSRSPWWVDYNHAPPGAGYLHVLFSLNTKGPFSDHLKEVAGENQFAAKGRSLDFRDARITVRLRGELEGRGAKLRLLVQGRSGEIISGWLLAGKPFTVTNRWTEQTIALATGKGQWTCIRGRHDRLDYYNYLPLETVLKEVSCNIMFVLFPLEVTPMGPISGDPHVLRAGKDYPVWTHRLPEGYVQLDTVRIKFRT